MTRRNDLYLYDPRTNVITKTSYEILEGITGKSKTKLYSYRSKGMKISSINSYILREDTTVKQRKKWYAKEKFADEMWLQIIGSEGKFLISNYGRFKRVYKKATSFLLPSLRRHDGSLWIKVSYNGIYRSYKVATLVGVHFLGEPDPGQVLRHKNGIKTDDFVGNLEYISKSELGRLTGYKSKSRPVVQIDHETLEVIDEFRSVREAGRKCFVSYQSVLDNCNGKTKSSADYHFMFADDYELKVEQLEKVN